MKTITGTENLAQISEFGTDVISLFEQYGMGKYFKSDNLKKTGRFVRLNTILKSNNVDAEAFIHLLNEAIANEHNVEETKWENLHFSALLPCGLRNPFKEYIEKHFHENEDIFKDLNYLMEGNVNHELSFYPLLDQISDIDELPDIILASDVNNFFHRPFIEKFISKGVFETYAPLPLNDYLQKAGFADTGNNFTMYTANMLVMVVDKNKLGNRKMPQCWDDILSPEFEKDIIMRGEENFFCNAVMLPFYKEHGFDAIHKLARNIKEGLHPAEMVKMVEKSADDGAAIYIMPYFFSKRLKTDNAEVVWPTDGAISSPVFLLVKKEKTEEHKELLDFLFNKDTAEVLKGRFFPATHPEVNYSEFPDAVKWLGWNFLNQDIGKLKEDIREEFMKYY